MDDRFSPNAMRGMAAMAEQRLRELLGRNQALLQRYVRALEDHRNDPITDTVQAVDNQKWSQYASAFPRAARGDSYQDVFEQNATALLTALDGGWLNAVGVGWDDNMFTLLLERPHAYELLWMLLHFEGAFPAWEILEIAEVSDLFLHAARAAPATRTDLVHIFSRLLDVGVPTSLHDDPDEVEHPVTIPHLISLTRRAAVRAAQQRLHANPRLDAVEFMMQLYNVMFIHGFHMRMADQDIVAMHVEQAVVGGYVEFYEFLVRRGGLDPAQRYHTLARRFNIYDFDGLSVVEATVLRRDAGAVDPATRYRFINMLRVTDYPFQRGIPATDNNETVLTFAVLSMDAVAVRALLEAGADANYTPQRAHQPRDDYTDSMAAIAIVSVLNARTPEENQAAMFILQMLLRYRMRFRPFLDNNPVWAEHVRLHVSLRDLLGHYDIRAAPPATWARDRRGAARVAVGAVNG